MNHFFLFLKKYIQKHLYFLKLLLAFCFLAIVLSKIDFQKINSFGWIPLLWGILIVFASNVFGNISWHLILKFLFQKPFAFKITISAFWLGLFFNNILPSNVGGDIIKGFAIHSNTKKPLLVTFSIFIDRFLGLFILMNIGVCSYVYYVLSFSWMFSLGMFFVFNIMGVFLFKHAVIFGYLFFQKIKGSSSNPIETKKIFQKFFAQKTNIFKILVITFFSQFLKILMNYAIAISLNQNESLAQKQLLMPPEYVFFLVPLFGIFALISITPGGVGVKEYLCVLLFETFPFLINTPSNTHYLFEITTIGIISHLLVIIASLPGIFFFLKHSKKFQSKKALFTKSST